VERGVFGRLHDCLDDARRVSFAAGRMPQGQGAAAFRCGVHKLFIRRVSALTRSSGQKLNVNVGTRCRERPNYTSIPTDL
jgi:hypothetical protein